MDARAEQSGGAGEERWMEGRGNYQEVKGWWERKEL